MNKARCFANRFSEVSRKRNYIVIGSLLDLVNACDRKLRAVLDLLERVARNGAHLSVDFADSDFHVQPLLELCLFRPEHAHFGQCVAINHGFRFSRTVSAIRVSGWIGHSSSFHGVSIS